MSKTYLCDKKDNCYWHSLCAGKEYNIAKCNHTSNPKHALCSGCDEDDYLDDFLVTKCFNCSKKEGK